MRFCYAPLLVLLVTIAGCRGSADPIAGELGHSRQDGEWLAFSGDFLFATYDCCVYTLDVSDPRNPIELDTFANANLPIAYGFVVQGGRGYGLWADELSEVSLPQADWPNWQYGLPDGDEFHANALTTLGGRPLIARSRQGSNTNGDLLLLDVSSGSPSVPLRLVSSNGDHRNISVDDPYVVIDAWIGEIGSETFDLVVYDTTVLSTAMQVARFSLTLPPGHSVSTITALNRDVIVTAGGPIGEPGAWIGWLRFDETYSSMQVMDEIADTDGLAANTVGNGSSPPMTSDGYFFLSYAVAGERDATVVMRMDPELGLVEERRLRGRGFVGKMALDEDRGLLYVGGHALQIFDLGAITTGDPRW